MVACRPQMRRKVREISWKKLESVSMVRQVSMSRFTQAICAKISPRAPLFLLFAVLGIALGLRLWEIDFGLPYEGITYDQVTLEESKEVHRAFKLGAGEYSWSFGKGGLYYLLFIEYGIFYVVSWVFGWVGDTREFALQTLQDRTTVYLMGRITVALMGTLTCLVVYAIGKRLYDWRVGLGAAFIGATSYFHGVFSTVINVDIGMTLALWASILLYLAYEKRKKPRFLVGAGVLGAVAIAFKLPGVVVLPLLFLAIASAPENKQYPRQMLRECGTVFVALLVTLTVIAPEWIGSIGSIHHSFSRILGLTPTIPTESGDINETIRSITVIGGTWTGYLRHLVKDYNLVLTISAVLGIGLGLMRRHRWDIICGGLIIVFIGIMSMADRTQPERYLLPIMPALWLLSSRAVATITKRHWSLTVTGLACVAIVPLVGLVRHDYEKTQPDTRVLAKQWIETNVPSGSKLLMDGMRFRFIPSPPLNPDKSTVARQVAQAAQTAKEEGPDFARGVSGFALSLYKEALEQVEGPTYELHSTNHGLDLETPSYYVQNCFDYIVTSSIIAGKFAPGRSHRERFPQAAQFYEQLPIDARFRLTYQAAAAPWKNVGPTISVYEVIPPC